VPVCLEEHNEILKNGFKQTARDTRHCYDDPGFHREKHTVSDYTRWHPHLHPLVADGLIFESGYFYVMPKVDIRRCATEQPDVF